MSSRQTSDHNQSSQFNVLLGSQKVGFQCHPNIKKLGVSQPSVSISVRRGEQIVKSMKLELIKE